MKNNKDTNSENYFHDDFDNHSDTSSIFSFDDTWIHDYNNSITIDDVDDTNDKCIKAYFLYVEKDQGTLNTINSNIITNIKNKYVYYKNYIPKSTIYNLIKEYSTNNLINYSLYFIFKYQNTFTSKDLEQFISDDTYYYNSNIPNNNFLTIYKNLDDIYIDNLSIDILSPLTSIYFVFMKPFSCEKVTVNPSLKIPYSDKKSERKSRINKKTLKLVKSNITRKNK